MQEMSCTVVGQIGDMDHALFTEQNKAGKLTSINLPTFINVYQYVTVSLGEYTFLYIHRSK